MPSKAEMEAAQKAVRHAFSQFGLSVAWELKDAIAAAALLAAEKVRSADAHEARKEAGSPVDLEEAVNESLRRRFGDGESHD